eukprot:1018265-Rhodomonas_salina.2
MLLQRFAAPSLRVPVQVASTLRACYAMPGTDPPYAPTARSPSTRSLCASCYSRYCAALSPMLSPTLLA